MRVFKIILVVAILVIVFLLIRQNMDVLSQQCQFKLNLGLFSFQSVSHPVWVIFLFALLLGIVVTGLYSLVAIFRLRKDNRQLNHELTILKSELETIKPVMPTPAEAAPASPGPETGPE